MQIVESYKNKKSNRQNYISRNKSTKASPSVATANVVINVELATQRLNELLNTYEEKSDWNNPRGFLTDLRTALGIPNTKGASKYGVVNNEAFTASISLTNHNSNAQTYIDADANYPYNLRLLIRKRYRKNTFKPNKDVTLEEYVYFGSDLAKCTVGNPYQLIIKSIINFLHNGTYIDSTGVARKNTSPVVNNTNESKTRKDMKTNRIKLTESQLKRMVSKAVRNVLKEAQEQTPYGTISTNPLSQTFSDTDTQNRFVMDTTNMLANLSDERFMRYWNMRMRYNDPNVIDAIYKEGIKRGLV